jgi:hypothetical protein
MILRYSRISLMLGALGICVALIGLLAFPAIIPHEASELQIAIAVTLAVLLGAALLLAGLAYYAKAKGRSPWWCFTGLLALALLQDRSEGATPS